MSNDINEIKRDILRFGLREHIARMAEDIISIARGSHPYNNQLFGKNFLESVTEKNGIILAALKALVEYEDD